MPSARGPDAILAVIIAALPKFFAFSSAFTIAAVNCLVLAVTSVLIRATVVALITS